MREKYVAVKDDKIYVVVNNQLHGKFHVQHLEGLDRVNENELVIKYKKRGRDYGNICSLRLTDSEEKIDDIEKMLKKQATLVGI